MKPSQGLCWSPGRKKWLCHDAALIDQIIASDGFVVPAYDYAELEERLDQGFPATRAVIRHFPLAHEGDAHQALRQRMTLDVTANLKEAINVFVDRLEAGVAAMSLPRGEADIARPLIDAVLASNLVLAGVCLPEGLDYSDLTLMLDDSQSLKNRVRREAFIRSLSVQMKAGPGQADMDESHIPYKLALISVGVNALISSVLHSLIHVLTHRGVQGLGDAKFFPLTGIKRLERVCVRAVHLQGHDVLPGDRVCLHVAVHAQDGRSDLVRNRAFFALDSPHACIGMNYSLSIWKATTRILVDHFREMRVLGFDLRPHDGVFDFPNRIRVEYCR